MLGISIFRQYNVDCIAQVLAPTNGHIQNNSTPAASLRTTSLSAIYVVAFFKPRQYPPSTEIYKSGWSLRFGLPNCDNLFTLSYYYRRYYYIHVFATKVPTKKEKHYKLLFPAASICCKIRHKLTIRYSSLEYMGTATLSKMP